LSYLDKYKNNNGNKIYANKLNSYVFDVKFVIDIFLWNKHKNR